MVDEASSLSVLTLNSFFIQFEIKIIQYLKFYIPSSLQSTLVVWLDLFILNLELFLQHRGSAMKTSIIAVCNQKGGVGKTTTVVNLASSYACLGKKVIVIDTDYQANATIGVGQGHLQNSDKNLYHAVKNELTFDKVLQPTSIPNLSIVAGSWELNELENELENTPRRDVWMEHLLDTDKLNLYDIVIIDMHPSINCFFNSCMAASHYYLIPLFPEKYSAVGLHKQIQAAEEVRKYLNKMLYPLGALVTKFKSGKEGNQAMVNAIRASASKSNLRLLETCIPYSGVVQDAEEACQPLNQYKYSKGQPVAHAYTSAATEILLKLKGRRIGRQERGIQYDKLLEDDHKTDSAALKKAKGANSNKSKIVKKAKRNVKKSKPKASEVTL